MSYFYNTGNDFRTPTEDEAYQLHAAYLRKQADAISNQYSQDPQNTSWVQVQMANHFANLANGWASGGQGNSSSGRPHMMVTAGGLAKESAALGDDGEIPDEIKAWMQMNPHAAGPRQLVDGTFHLDSMERHMQNEAKQQQSPYFDPANNPTARDPYHGWYNSNTGMANGMSSVTGMPIQQQPQLRPMPAQNGSQQGLANWYPADAFNVQSSAHADMINSAFSNAFRQKQLDTAFSGDISNNEVGAGDMT